jgi:hypothetical protein
MLFDVPMFAKCGKKCLTCVATDEILSNQEQLGSRVGGWAEIQSGHIVYELDVCGCMAVSRAQGEFQCA